jgi:rhodanese-related sulfurtransferase
MKRNLIIIAVIIIIIALGYMYFPSSPVRDDGTIDTAQISREVSRDKAVLMDVRTSTELVTDGYAAGSTHFELARLQNGELPSYDKDERIYVYCKAGGRAEQAKTILEENGFTNVINIGGLSDWEDSGGEVAR